MMNTLKYSLEYLCYPIWNYDETGDLIDNDLPEELRNDEELDAILVNIQERFDSLYTDTPKEFSANGFRSAEERLEFLSLLFSSVDLLQKKYGSLYHIECKYTMDSFPLELED